MDFKTAYGPKRRVSLSFPTKGRTRQSFKAECDINNIMSRFRKTGVLDFTSRYEAQYGDVTAVDFTAAMNTVAQARGMFFAMPAHIRDRFGNKPENFLAFVQNPANKDEARHLGLLKPEVPAPIPAPAAAPAPALAPAAQPAGAAPQAA